MRRRSMGGAGVVLIGLVVAAAVAGPWLSNATPSAQDRLAAPVETAPVHRRDLTVERAFDATVTFGDPWVLRTDAAGVVTRRHEPGIVVGFAEELIRIDDKPLVLARGDMPMYRELSKVDSERQTGDDVAQLQRFLLDAGFDADGKLEVDGVFGNLTEAAVRAWQKSVGLPVTGKVDSAQVVFAPQPVRIASAIRVGDLFTELEVGNTVSEVQVDTSTRDRGYLLEGTAVVVHVLGTETALGGVVQSQEEIKGDQGSTLWRTTIVTDPAIDPTLTATSAEVEVTRVVAADVLTVPVAALLALAEGGYAVETVDDDGSTTMVRVELGQVADGIAEIDGDVAEGDEVVMPS